MSQVAIDPPVPQSTPRKTGVGLFVFGSLVMVSTMAIGFFVEREMLARVMFYIQQKSIPPLGEFYPYELGLTMLFAFGLPLGMVALFSYGIKRTEPHSPTRRRLIFIGFLLFSIVILAPVIWGRQPSNWFFGISGIFIIAAIILTFWFSSRFRANLEKPAKSAFDFQLLGYLCFGMVTWHICGFANAPGFALFPEKMIELEVQPFAIGQLKAIMLYFVAGWILTTIGIYKSMNLHKRTV